MLRACFSSHPARKIVSSTQSFAPKQKADAKQIVTAEATLLATERNDGAIVVKLLLGFPRQAVIEGQRRQYPSPGR